MVKRKREEEGHARDDGDTSAKQQRLQFKLEQGTKKLAHAFKIAKGSERQKLGRREKTARGQKNDKDVVRIQSEIAVLKTLDTSASAQLYLYKTLSKIKAVAASDLFVDILSNPPPAIHDIAALNIHGRLCSSVSVKEALSSTIDDLLQAAHVESRGSSKREIAPSTKEPMGVVQEDEQLDEETNEDDTMSNASRDEYRKFEHRLASSDDDDLESGEDGVSTLERQLLSEGIQQDDEAFSGSEEESEFDGFEFPASTQRKPLRSAATKGGSSIILPSLTMGGYISASDGSEAEDIDVAPRKNRPGQRARQAIWEKKYGTKAKHLKDGVGSRDQGWDAKRGATGGGARDGRRSLHSGRDDATSKKAVPVAKKKDDSGPLHPSWVAAKKAKEKIAGIPTFTGTKISFD